MYSCCNLSFCSAVIILFENLNCLAFYISAVFCKIPFYFRTCSAHASSDVIMINYVFKFQSNPVNLVSSRRFLIADYKIY